MHCRVSAWQTNKNKKIQVHKLKFILFLSCVLDKKFFPFFLLFEESIEQITFHILKLKGAWGTLFSPFKLSFAYISHFESKILKRIPKAKNYTDSEIQTTIFGAIQFLSSFLWWGLWFYFEFWFLFWSVLGYASLRPDCVILNWVCLCFLLGIAYFCLGSLFLTPD